MNLQINEKERDFLERICSRTECFSRLHIMNPKKSFSEFERDLKSIDYLLNKIRELKNTD